MNLKLLDGAFSVCKLPPDSQLPQWALQSCVFFVSKTSDELSIICESTVVPAGVAASRGWRCFRVDGDLGFEQVGVVATVSAPVADAGVSLFLVSTHDRDYVLVHQENLEHVVRVYQQCGFTVDITADQL